jgi:CysZ protein
MFAGFLAPFRGALFLFRRRALWRYAAIPLFLNILLVIAAIWAWMAFVVPFGASLVPGGEGWLSESGRWVARVILYIAALPLVLGVYLVVASLLGGPFYEILCERVEREVMGRAFDDLPPRNLARVAIDGIRVELGNLVVAILGGILAFMLPILVPGFGAIVSIPIGWFLAGFDFIAYPFDRRALKLRKKIGIALSHLPATLGFGLAVWLMLLPLVTLPFAAPCAVVGAALLFPGGRRAARVTARS